MMRWAKGFFSIVNSLAGSPGNAVRAAVEIFKTRGILGIYESLRFITSRASEISKTHTRFANYSQFLNFTANTDAIDLGFSKKNASLAPPLISVVIPIHKPKIDLLRQTIDSVISQSYKRWQLVLVDDFSQDQKVDALLMSFAENPKIIVLRTKSNQGISLATNTAVEHSSGEYVGFLDHDDLLHPNALDWYAIKLSEVPQAKLIYCDEDKITPAGVRFAPHFKPDFNPELLLAYNYLNHFTLIQKALFQKLGALRPALDGAQDFDLVLRASETLHPTEICHVPKILYHWRASQGSTAQSQSSKTWARTASLDAVRQALLRRGVEGEVGIMEGFPTANKVSYALESQPKVTIIVPTRDNEVLLDNCLASILERTTYTNYEIDVIDNGSIKPSTLEYLRRLRDSRVNVRTDSQPFNYSAINNKAAQIATGDFICFLNDDTQVISSGWLEELVSCAQQTDVGAVGARLWYPNDTVQHAGIVLGIGAVAGHALVGLRRGVAGHAGRALLRQNVSGVTAACILISRKQFTEIGGFDENLAVGYNDVDMCLKITTRGKKIIWTPQADLLHFESISRGRDSSPEQIARAASETSIMIRKWGGQLRNDPFYNPNFRKDSASFNYL